MYLTEEDIYKLLENELKTTSKAALAEKIGLQCSNFYSILRKEGRQKVTTKKILNYFGLEEIYIKR